MKKWKNALAKELNSVLSFELQWVCMTLAESRLISQGEQQSVLPSSQGSSSHGPMGEVHAQ